jgi:hypothetical protein
MRFLVDSMLPPKVADDLNKSGHDAVTPTTLGAHNLPDDVLIELASAQGRVIVTENASDFAHVTTCPVLLVRKSWWPQHVVAARLATALDRWAATNPEPGSWAHWLEAELR